MMREFDKYRLIEKIGSGGMGQVFKAKDPGIDRTVAIKIVTTEGQDLEELNRRLYQEANAAGKLSHENITVIHAVGEYEGRPYIVMEYLKGKDLKSVIQGKDEIDLAEKINYGIQILRGLGYAHDHKVVHRDVKPENIKILPDGRVKIMDFGIAKQESTSLTGKGVMLGTPSYISPEQIRGQLVDLRADIFSFGVLFQELLTYRRPFTGSLSTLLYKIIHDEPEQLEMGGLPYVASFQKVLSKCLQKDREDRYNNCREVIADLTAILDDCEDLSGETMLLSTVYEPDGSKVDLGSAGTTVKNLLTKGRAYFDGGDFDSAKKIFSLILETVPDHKLGREFMDRVCQEMTAIEASLGPSSPTESLVQTGHSRRMWPFFIVLPILVGLFFLWFQSRTTELERETAREVAARPTSQASGRNFEGEADLARKQVAGARSAASLAGAEKVAAALFLKAETQEKKGDFSLKEKNYHEALSAYQTARRLFERARARAETKSAPANGLPLLKDREATANARKQAESAGAAANATDLYREALKQQQDALAAEKRGNRESLVDANVFFQSATVKFREAADLARGVSRLKKKAVAARSQMTLAKQPLLKEPKIEKRSEYQLAISLEEKGGHFFLKKKFEGASSLFEEAKAKFVQIGTELGTEKQAGANDLKRRVETMRAGAETKAPSFSAGKSAQELGNEALLRGFFQEASGHYQSALNHFERSRMEPVATEPAPTLPAPNLVETSPVGETLQRAVDRLTGQYISLMERLDAKGLAQMLGHTQQEQKNWEAFFSQSEKLRVQVKTTAGESQPGQGKVTVFSSISYFNKSNSSRSETPLQMEWRLEKVSDEWRIKSSK